MSKVVLVTGGSGYFGNLLVRQLCDDGYFVRIFGKFSVNFDLCALI